MTDATSDLIAALERDAKEWSGTVGPTPRLEREAIGLILVQRAELAQLRAERNALRTECEALREFYEGVAACFGDTWQCACGRAEDWWMDCNADYATREAVKKIAALRERGEE